MDNTTWGYNALMLAAHYDHQDVARMLIDAGADTSLLTNTSGVDENHWSNIMVAAWRGDKEVRASFSAASLGCANPLNRPVIGAHSSVAVVARRKPTLMVPDTA